MYNKLFTLSDLFHNKELKGYLPQIKLTERSREGFQAKSYRVFGFKDLEDEIKMYAIMGARIDMSRVSASGNAPTITISGKLRKNHDIYQAYNSVLSILKGASGSLTLLGSYGDVITDVFKKIVKSAEFRMGKKPEPKLYLRINNLNEIKNMNKAQKDAFLKNVIENIYFSDDFKEFREPNMERHSFIVNNRNVVRGYDSLKRDFDRKVRY